MKTRIYATPAVKGLMVLSSNVLSPFHIFIHVNIAVYVEYYVGILACLRPESRIKHTGK